MATGSNIRTYFEGTWHDGDVPIMRAADHGAWLGTTVFDGARLFEGVTPDLDRHCERVNRSARSLMISPSHSTDEMVAIIQEGLQAYPKDAAVYIRPMYWALDGGPLAIVPKEGSTGFAVSLEQVAMPPETATTTLTRTRFRRPVLEDAVVNAKAGCLYPNNARMLRDVVGRGFQNAIVCDAIGNVAETATSNVFMAKDGVVMTPVPSGCFLNGITRQRTISLLREDGVEVVEKSLSLQDFMEADEIFTTGNAMKVMHVTQLEDRNLQYGRLAKRARELYWDYAASA